MKIIFLDIDGVICTLRSHFAFGDDRGLMLAWDITVCQMIRELCAKHNAKIVVTSTWRKHPRRNLRYYLEMYDLIEHMYEGKKDKEIKKKKWYYEGDEWKTPVLKGIRGKEVRAWLKEHPDVKRYVILDDDSDFFAYQKKFLIHTDGYEGFGARDYMKCDELLGEKKWKKGRHV